MANIGKRIKARREELGITQAELAKRLGYKSKTTIAKIESGVNDIVQSKVVSFAEALDTTPAYLMGWEEKESLSNTLTKNIKMYREKLGLSQAFVADILETPLDYVEAFENGTITPTTEELRLLSRCFGIPVQDFLDDHQNDSDPKFNYIKDLLYENGYIVLDLHSISQYLVRSRFDDSSYLIDSSTFDNYFNSVNDYIQYNFDKMLSNFEPDGIKKCIAAQVDALNATNEKVSELEKRLDKLE